MRSDLPRTGLDRVPGTAGRRHSQHQPEHPEAEVVERGDIFFLYRPKLDADEPENLDEVQRFSSCCASTASTCSGC